MVIMQFCVFLKLHLPLSYKGGEAEGEANVITNLSAIQQPQGLSVFIRRGLCLK